MCVHPNNRRNPKKSYYNTKLHVIKCSALIEILVSTGLVTSRAADEWSRLARRIIRANTLNGYNYRLDKYAHGRRRV